MCLGKLLGQILRLVSFELPKDLSFRGPQAIAALETSFLSSPNSNSLLTLETAFYNLHRDEVLQKYADLAIGTIQGEKPEIIHMKKGDLSQVPYAEPLWLRPEFKSPYYNDSHRALQKAMRIFTDTYITPIAQAREADGKYVDQELIDRMAKENIIAMRLGPGKHLHGKTLLGGIVKPEEFDYFHDLVLSQEMSRTNARGFQDGNLSGLVISLTAVQEWLNNEGLKKHVNEECLSGRKKICLAISEAFAGSDVAGIRTTAGSSTSFSS